MTISELQFIEYAAQNETNARLLDGLAGLQLPQTTLTAGCLFQTVWNLKSGYEPERAIKDYDVFYFDADDLSWEAEDAVIRRANRFLGDLAEKVEIRNQARVHLWYERKFGAFCPPLRRVEDGIDRYLVACTRLGIRIGDRSLYAPDGLEDMWNGILRLNPNNPQIELFERKCRDYQARWPWLTMAV